jgi:hypothetical protein
MQLWGLLQTIDLPLRNLKTVYSGRVENVLKFQVLVTDQGIDNTLIPSKTNSHLMVLKVRIKTIRRDFFGRCHTVIMTGFL